MKLILSLFFVFLFTLNGFSQVGIGTTDPQADLDIRTPNPAAPLATSGIAIPQVNVLPPAGNRAGQFVYLTTTSSYHYFDGVSWARLNLRTLALVKTITSNYTLLNADTSYIILADSATDITLTVPAGLTTGHNVTVYQVNSGKVTFTQSGSTVKNRLNRFTTAGMDATAGLVNVGSDTYYVSGDLVK